MSVELPNFGSEPESVAIIPTGYKVKLPKSLSYPLEGVPQTGSLLVDFWFWNRQRLHLHIPPQPYRVLSVSYWHTAVNNLYRKFYMVAGRFDPGW